MKQELTYSYCRNYLEERQKEIDASGHGTPGILNTFKQIANSVARGYHLGLVVALQNRGHLEKMLKQVQYQHQNKKNNLEEIQKAMATIYQCANQCFLRFQPTLQPLLTYFKPKIEKHFQKISPDYGGQNERYKVIATLLQHFHEAAGKDEDNQKIRSLNKFVRELQSQSPKSAFEECVFSWIRARIQSIHSEVMRNKKYEMGLCCYLHFEEQGKLSQVSTLTQNFSRNIPIFSISSQYPNRQQIEKNDVVRKQVVSYLNSTGGILYIGIELTSQKDAKFYGLPITIQDRKEILKALLIEIALKIYPSQGERQDEDEDQEKLRLEKYQQTCILHFNRPDASFNQEYKLTDYISVDFIPVYNSKTLFYSRDEENGYIKYVTRVKVKLGDPAEVYHFINDKDMPEAYIREKEKERKLTMIQYYNEIYKRLKDQANNKVREGPTFHQFCRLDPKSIK